MAVRASLKIPTAVLIANAEKQLAKEKKDYEEALVKYEASVPAWEAQVAEAFATADPSTVSVESVYSNGGYRRVIQVAAPHLKGSKPWKPSEPCISDIEADIRFLRATTQETVNVSVGSELSRYL